jgi:hypothetical protein
MSEQRGNGKKNGLYPKINIYLRTSKPKDKNITSKFLGCTTWAKTLDEAIESYCKFNEIDNKNKDYFAKFSEE